MADPRPVRLQLSRRKGFSLQALSHATNGLPAVNVARPSIWGNPFNFRASEYCWLALSFGCRGDRAGRQQASVHAFREWIGAEDKRRVLLMELQVTMGDGANKVPIGPRINVGVAPSREMIKEELSNKNLACWCALSQPCHADVLLQLANAQTCEAVPAARDAARRARR